MKLQAKPAIFDEETWAQMPSFLGNLPASVHLHMWGDEAQSEEERETAVLLQALADHFDNISLKLLPRRVNYPYYPVIGIWGEQEGEPFDYGVRLIGWPTGYQLTSLITGIQVVAFRGQTLEPKTRVQLKGLSTAVNLEILTAADNESGAVLAKIGFGLAVASEHIKAFLIMADQFPEASLRYSANYLPHMVINGRVHLEGMADEEVVMTHIAKAVRANKPAV